jgi:hypothetical protein
MLGEKMADRPIEPTDRNTARKLDRRRFLTGVAAGAGLAPLAGLTMSLGTSSAAPASAVDNLCTGPTVLAPNDLSYLGKINLPDDDPGSGVRMGYSRGTFTGRRVNGELRLFITGSVGGNGDYRNEKDAIYEVRAVLNQRASLVRNWGNVAAGRQLLRDMQQEPTIRGLYYSAGRLWWAYGSNYFNGFEPDPSIGCSLLNDATGAVTKFGPWRTQEHSQMTRGYMVEIPSDYAFAGGRRIAVGAPVTSGNAQGPRGAVLTAMDTFDPAALPPDIAGNGITHVSVGGKRMIFHDYQHPQERNANYKKCGWNVDYDSSKGGYVKPGTPSFENPDGMALDTVSAAAWVRTPTCEGIVFIGQITDIVPGKSYPTDGMPHMWYGPQAVECPHGHDSGAAGTGPKSTSEVPMLWIYDPAVVASASTPWGFPAAHAVRLNTLPNVGSNIYQQAIYPYHYGNAWFDATDNRLYVSEINAEHQGEPRPVIHVFSVRAS